MTGDDSVFADGAPVKLYSTNISWDDMAAAKGRLAISLTGSEAVCFSRMAEE